MVPPTAPFNSLKRSCHAANGRDGEEIVDLVDRLRGGRRVGGAARAPGESREHGHLRDMLSTRHGGRPGIVQQWSADISTRAGGPDRWRLLAAAHPEALRRPGRGCFSVANRLPRRSAALPRPLSRRRPLKRPPALCAATLTCCTARLGWTAFTCPSGLART
jgi:hypothetical protein